MALGLGAPAHAQADQAQPPEPEIVVPGDLDEGERKKAVNRFIRAVMRAPKGQYARFSEPICPSAIGFSSKVETLIEARIREVSEAAGIEVADGACKPNLHLMAVSDGREAIRSLRSRRTGAFGQMLPAQRNTIARGEGPVFNWHVVFPISTDDGRNRARLGSGYVPATGSDPGRGGISLLSEDGYKAGLTNAKSRLLKSVKQDITHGFVLIEREALLGLSPIQIADFAAMRGLLSADPENEDLGPVSTIMTLFDEPKEAGLPGLTEWDLALLAALYRAPVDMNADRQRSLMAKLFLATLENGG
ncbi:MAG: hypothetical protein AAF291_09435 [Pseudomonadota bacterium]